MNPSNKEIQLHKNCQLYAYVLKSLGKEVPEIIEECARSYDYPVECIKELSILVQSLDTETFDSIVNNTDSQEARDLAHWWEMYQQYMPIQK